MYDIAVAVCNAGVRTGAAVCICYSDWADYDTFVPKCCVEIKNDFIVLRPRNQIIIVTFPLFRDASPPESSVTFVRAC